MSFTRILFVSLVLVGLPAGAAWPAADRPGFAAGKPEAGTAASVGAATGAAVSELLVLAPPKPPSVSELEVLAPPKPKTVSEMDVTAKVKCVPPQREWRGRAPRILSTYPREGGVVRPGLMILRITFDQPMSCAGYFVFDQGTPNPCGDSGDLQHMLMTFDRRTVRTPCLILPNTRYSLWMNQQVPDPLGSLTPAQFVSMTGWRLERYRLTFTTSSQPMVQTVREALGEDSETKLAPGV
ncbi:MAG: hypothetical protein E8A12_07605 [Phenylobacterium sp.]|nr:MAG: hypothetical protein E8A12_07605 [Phenylobacterium sp.]